jgi:hypothetical protein
MKHTANVEIQPKENGSTQKKQYFYDNLSVFPANLMLGISIDEIIIKTF